MSAAPESHRDEMMQANPDVDSPGAIRFTVDDGSGAVLCPPISPGLCLVGRDPAADLHLASGDVSWHHARIMLGPENFTVEDLGSKWGTWCHGERLVHRQTLAYPHEIRFASVRVLIEKAPSVDAPGP